MNINIDTIQSQIESESFNFFKLITKLRTLYPKQKLNPSSQFKQEYISLNNEIDQSFEKMYLIKNKLIKASDNLEISTNKQDEFISTLKSKIDTQEKELNTVLDYNLASAPRKRAKEREYKLLLASVSFQSSIIILYVYLFYKLMKN